MGRFMISAVHMRPRQETLDYSDRESAPAPFLLLRRTEQRFFVVDRDLLATILETHRVRRESRARKRATRLAIGSLSVLCAILVALVLLQRFGG
jgi:hypothetical protein